MKNIIVTGASKGIGYATALEFAAQEHQVLAIARTKSKLVELEEKSGGIIKGVEADLTRQNDTLYIEEHFSKVDIVIHNAGYLVNKPFKDITEKELEASYRLNAMVPFMFTQQVLPYLNPDAHILMIGSVGGVTGTQKFPGLSAYSSSKAAMSCLAEVLQAEYAETGITFNSLALGAVQTEMLAAAFPGYQAPVTPASMAKYIVNFALSAPSVIRGKTTLVSRTNP